MGLTMHSVVAPEKRAEELNAIEDLGLYSAANSLGCYPLHSPRTSDFSRFFLPTAEWTLEQGMVFHMYVSADGIAINETVLVTETGHECLTRAPRQVFQV